MCALTYVTHDSCIYTYTVLWVMVQGEQSGFKSSRPLRAKGPRACRYHS